MPRHGASVELRKRDVPHQVLVIGEGPAKEFFAEKVPEAKFVGFQQDEDLGRAVASMDVLLNPSVTETFGNVTLEAMACGVPVVAADATGASSLVLEGETGHLVPPRDIAAYADKLAAYGSPWKAVVRKPSYRKRMIIGFLTQWGAEFGGPLVIVRRTFFVEN